MQTKSPLALMEPRFAVTDQHRRQNSSWVHRARESCARSPIVRLHHVFDYHMWHFYNIIFVCLHVIIFSLFFFIFVPKIKGTPFKKWRQCEKHKLNHSVGCHLWASWFTIIFQSFYKLVCSSIVVIKLVI
jgi:hypothetical protein